MFRQLFVTLGTQISAFLSLPGGELSLKNLKTERVSSDLLSQEDDSTDHFLRRSPWGFPSDSHSCQHCDIFVIIL